MQTQEDDDDVFVGQVLSRRKLLTFLGASGVFLMLGPGCGEGGSGESSGGSGSASSASTGSATTTTTSTSGTGTVTGTVTAGGTSGGTTGTTVTVATPSATEGPFFVASDSILRSDLVTGLTSRAAVLQGRAMNFQLTLYRLSGGVLTPLQGAHIDLWQADAGGAYSDESTASGNTENTVGESFLRGRQITDANGQVTFQAIYPGWYISRTIHTHLKVRMYDTSGNVTYTFNTQLFYDDTFSDTIVANSPYNTRGARSVRNVNDGIYNGSTVNGLPIGDYLLATVASGTPLTASFNLALQV